MTMSEVQRALADLDAGVKTIEQVEDFFRTRVWPEDTTTPDEEMTADFMPILSGSFSEVAQAFYEHRLTIDQFSRLANAATGNDLS